MAKLWNDIEREILRVNRSLPAAHIRVVLKRAGYARSEASIETQLSYLRAKDKDGTGQASLALPERKEALDAHMVPMMPNTPLLQRYVCQTFPVSVTMSRAEEADPFEEMWESALRPGAKFASYELLRIILAPT